MNIRPFDDDDTDAVVKLWQACELTKPWNDPYLDIKRKSQVMPELFLVGELNKQIVASVMAGYDGHRGWINYLAVQPDQQGKGLGGQLMSAVEQQLLNMGCPKINLQVRTSNLDVIEYYEHLGYVQDACVSLGKRLIPDD